MDTGAWQATAPLRKSARSLPVSVSDLGLAKSAVYIRVLTAAMEEMGMNPQQ